MCLIVFIVRFFNRYQNIGHNCPILVNHDYFNYRIRLELLCTDLDVYSTTEVHKFHFKNM